MSRTWCNDIPTSFPVGLRHFGAEQSSCSSSSLSPVLLFLAFLALTSGPEAAALPEAADPGRDFLAFEDATFSEATDPTSLSSSDLEALEMASSFRFFLARSFSSRADSSSASSLFRSGYRLDLQPKAAVRSSF